MYLCGFTLFLSLILNRTYVMMLEVLRLEDKVKQLEGNRKAGGKDSVRLAQAGEIGEIGRLRKQLEAKDHEIEDLKKDIKTKKLDIETLRKQSEGLAAEYNKLGDQVTGKSEADEKSRKDL